MVRVRVSEFQSIWGPIMSTANTEIKVYHTWATGPCWWFPIILTWGLVVLVTASAWAQAPAKPAAKPAAKEEEEKKPPEPVPVRVDTRDGWRIHCLYYPPMEGIRKGTETVPIILLHGWGGLGSEWDYLARGLQTYGHASIVPDLRGHGRSTNRREPDGTPDTRRYEELTLPEMENMIQDVEAIKSHLLERHNTGELNIEMLTVIAAEEGCIVALNWAVVDWSWPVTPTIKQGQDVQLLVLLSPTTSFKRMNANRALQTPVVSRRLSLLFAVGADERAAASEARRLHTRLERQRPPLDRDPERRLRQQDLFLVTAPTSLQGTALTGRGLPINRAIVGVIKTRLLDRRDDFTWKERRSPLGN